MTKVSLPFFNGGQAFDPKIYPDDLADYEDAEAKAIESKRLSNLVKAKAAFVERVLRREPILQHATTGTGTASSTATVGGAVPLQLTAGQVNHAWSELWHKGLDGRDPDAPLAQGGASSAPSSSQA